MTNNVVVQIPCLNEESTIGDVVRGFKKKLPKAKVIVYDNNSTDNSVKLAKKNGAELMTQTTIDHLVIGAAELDKATKQIQSFIKAEFLAGGKHRLMATQTR